MCILTGCTGCASLQDVQDVSVQVATALQDVKCMMLLQDVKCIMLVGGCSRSKVFVFQVAGMQGAQDYAGHLVG